jgi:hypothetical protein
MLARRVVRGVGMNPPPLILRGRFASPRYAGLAFVSLRSTSRPPRPPARVFRGGAVNSPPLIERVRFAAPGEVWSERSEDPRARLHAVEARSNPAALAACG